MVLRLFEITWETLMAVIFSLRLRLNFLLRLYRIREIPILAIYLIATLPPFNEQ